MGARHYAGTERGAAGDHVARHQRHVLRYRRHELVGRKEHVRHGIVLHFLAIENGANDKLGGVQPSRDGGPEHTESVEALRARPLIESREFLHQIDGGDVVYAGVAEDVVLRLSFADVGALLADDDTEFALIDDAAVVARWAADGFTGRVIGIRRLEEIERVGWALEVVLGGELMEIIPQANHFRWIAGREYFHTLEC